MNGPRPHDIPLGFGELSVPVPSHVCLFYYDDAELRLKLGFIRLGLETEREAVVLFGRRSRLLEVLGYLQADNGIDVDAQMDAGRIVLVESQPNVDSLLASIGQQLDTLVASGVELVRFLGFIGWGEPSWPTADDLLRFESQVTTATANYPAVVMCTYKLTDLPGPLLIYGGIETHPLTIIGDTVCENPHFVPPDNYAAQRENQYPWQTAGRSQPDGIRVSRGAADSE